MTEELNELQDLVVEEHVVLEKFDGEARKENLVERIHLLDGKITKWERLENGEVVEESDTYGGDE